VYAFQSCVVAVAAAGTLLALPGPAGAATAETHPVQCRMLFFSTDGASHNRLEGADCTDIAGAGSVSGPTETYDFRTKKFSFDHLTFTFTKAVRGETYGDVRTASGNKVHSTVFLAPKPA
jgi:hypothetical protein